MQFCRRDGKRVCECVSVCVGQREGEEGEVRCKGKGVKLLLFSNKDTIVLGSTYCIVSMINKNICFHSVEMRANLCPFRSQTSCLARELHASTKGGSQPGQPA